MKSYVVREDGVLVEALSKEETESLIENNEGSDLITKILELNRFKDYEIWIGDEEEFNSLSVKKTGVLYMITDNTIFTEISEELDTLDGVVSQQEDEVNDLNNITLANIKSDVETGLKELADMVIDLRNNASKNPSLSAWDNGDDWANNMGYLYGRLDVTFGNVAAVKERTVSVSTSYKTYCSYSAGEPDWYATFYLDYRFINKPERSNFTTKIEVSVANRASISTTGTGSVVIPYDELVAGQTKRMNGILFKNAGALTDRDRTTVTIKVTVEGIV